MRRLGLIFFILIIYTNFSFSADQYVRLNNKHIKYICRWDKSDLNNFHSYWGGASIDIKFEGNLLKINLLTPVNIFVQIDNGKLFLFKNANGWLQITPDSLPKSTHNIKIIAKFKDDEIDLAGISLNAGAKLLETDKKKYWIEFIGDSITSGDRTSKGNTSAYPWLTAEYFKANHTQISYNGIPLTSGYHYNYKAAPKIGMDSAFFNLQQPNHQPNKKWNFKIKPYLVVINLGTNDHNLKVPTALFLKTYNKFLTDLCSVYPKSSFVILIPFNQSYASQIKELIQIKHKSDKKLYLVDTENWLANNDFTDGTHPSDTGHLKVSNELVKIIKPLINN